MTNRRDGQGARMLRAASIAALCALAGVPGCEEKKAQPEVAPAPPPPPPKPRASLDGVKLHPKVQFSEDALPSSQEAVNAIAALANALASGDAAAMAQVIDQRDQAVLKVLVETGEWQRQADALKVVRVVSLRDENDSGFQVGLGLEDEGGAFLTGWQASGSADVFTFGGMAIEPRFAMAARELDGAELTLLELPTGNAVAVAVLKAAEPVIEEVDDEKKAGSSGSSGGGSKPRRGPRRFGGSLEMPLSMWLVGWSN
jgi:hypothetical protein